MKAVNLVSYLKGYGFTSTGIILVLYILLVIVLAAGICI